MASIGLGIYAGTAGLGRLAQNVAAVYRALDPELPLRPLPDIFDEIAELEGFTAVADLSAVTGRELMRWLTYRHDGAERVGILDAEDNVRGFPPGIAMLDLLRSPGGLSAGAAEAMATPLTSPPSPTSPSARRCSRPRSGIASAFSSTCATAPHRPA